MAVITTSGPLEASAGDPTLILDSFLKEPALSLGWGRFSLFGKRWTNRRENVIIYYGIILGAMYFVLFDSGPRLEDGVDG